MAAHRDPEIEELTDVLLNAFDKDSLPQMVRFSLGQRLETITLGPNLKALVSELIAWAELNGKTKVLIRGASKCNPDNPYLIEFVSKYGDWLSSPEAALSPPGPQKSHRLTFALFGTIALFVLVLVAGTVLGWPTAWPSLENSLASAFSPAAQSKPEIKLDAAKIRFVVTRENGDINQYSAGRVMRVAPGSSLLIEMGFAADDTSFSHELAYHYFAVNGSVQAANMGHTASYVAPLQPGTDILSVEIMRPDDTFKITRSLYIWVSE